MASGEETVSTPARAAQVGRQRHGRRGGRAGHHHLAAPFLQPSTKQRCRALAGAAPEPIPLPSAPADPCHPPDPLRPSLLRSLLCIFLGRPRSIVPRRSSLVCVCSVQPTPLLAYALPLSLFPRRRLCLTDQLPTTAARPRLLHLLAVCSAP